MVTHAPSGFQVELIHGRQRATVVEVGGGIREYTVGGQPVLDGYGPDEMCTGGSGQVLAPWPNRVLDGTYDLSGTTYHLALTEPERHNAIHGLVRFTNWTLAEHHPHRVVMAYRLHPQPGYPFLLDLRVTYRLDDDGLEMTIEATNLGPEPAPYGAGVHPYVRLGSGLVDGLELTVPAASCYETDARAVPIGRRTVDGTPFDFRTGRLVGPAALDTAFTDLTRGPDGRARVEVADPVEGRRVEVWCDERFGYLMVFSGDTLPARRRRRALAVEPMMCAPNAFRSGDGLLVLAPGETVSCRCGITPPD